ncbi:MAG: hypothetical protein CL583_10545 [Alteromonadaceae bacterium]|nr:hypothetical protein [Alteromonadaceae bacterium]|tara:strand:- start:1922 stop:2536 length:615 start_codon:yes stop_codon:yes gene_type:complete
MWTNGSGITTAAVAGAFLFSSYTAGAEVLVDELSEPRAYVANFEGVHWSSANFAADNSAREGGSEGEAALGIGDVIGTAKISLGLPNKDIAQIFGVTRQTLYSYSKGQDLERTANSQTRQRVFQLKPIVQKLALVLPKSPGAMAKNYSIGGLTLFDLLVKEELDSDRIVEVATALGEKLNQISGVSSRSPVSGNKTLHELTSHT